MNIKEVYETLEKVENGAELIGAIKAEVTKLNDEAKKIVLQAKQTRIKSKSYLKALALKIMSKQTGIAGVFYCVNKF